MRRRGRRASRVLTLVGRRILASVHGLGTPALELVGPHADSGGRCRATAREECAAPSEGRRWNLKEA